MPDMEILSPPNPRTCREGWFFPAKPIQVHLKPTSAIE